MFIQEICTLPNTGPLYGILKPPILVAFLTIRGVLRQILTHETIQAFCHMFIYIPHISLYYMTRPCRGILPSNFPRQPQQDQ